MDGRSHQRRVPPCVAICEKYQLGFRDYGKRKAGGASGAGDRKIEDGLPERGGREELEPGCVFTAHRTALSAVAGTLQRSGGAERGCTGGRVGDGRQLGDQGSAEWQDRGRIGGLRSFDRRKEMEFSGDDVDHGVAAGDGGRSDFYRRSGGDFFRAGCEDRREVVEFRGWSRASRRGGHVFGGRAAICGDTFGMGIYSWRALQGDVVAQCTRCAARAGSSLVVFALPEARALPATRALPEVRQ